MDMDIAKAADVEYASESGGVKPSFSEEETGSTGGENQSINSDFGLRPKSSQRLRYEAEVSVLKKKLGGLEEIREKLGLSQRKICQLLMVDPSAWTRWTKSGDDAPPHIYRSLQWYLALEEKFPALDVNFWLQTVARVAPPESFAGRNEVEALEEKLESVKQNFADQSLALMDRAFLEIENLKKTQSSQTKRLSFLMMLLLGAFLFFITGLALSAKFKI